MTTGTFNGEPYSIPDDCVVIGREHYYRLQAFATIASDLDRSAVGRHEGDAESQDPTGRSQGNPIWPVGTHIGYTLDGDHIVIPAREQRHDPAAWIRPRRLAGEP